MRGLICFVFAMVIGIGIIGNCPAAQNAMPLPPHLNDLPMVDVQPWVKVEDNPQTFLEGPAFDRQGNLFVTSLFDGRVIKITPDKKVTTVFQNSDLLTDGIAIHKDGRLFIACLNGKVISINPDGTGLTYIKPRHQGKPASANDLVFDRQGNLYVTDFTGNLADPTGGVFRFSADFQEVRPVIQNLAAANGIALDWTHNLLLVSETGRNQLIRIELLDDGISINPIAGVTIPYRFTGTPGGCDSNALDADGNLYQCLIFQGRLEILNRSGIPIANIVIPGREKGLHLGTTNVAFKPGTNEGYITVWGDGGAWIYIFRGLAKGVNIFSHQ